MSVCGVTAAAAPLVCRGSVCDMEVSADAKRIMVVALGKLYSSRSQRGGLRLHRSLLLTLVMKSARDMYHAAQTAAEGVASGFEEARPATAEASTQPAGAPGPQGPAPLRSAQPGSSEEVVVSTTELRRDAHAEESPCQSGAAQQTRKRRGKAAADPDFLPCKKAKLELGSSVSPALTDFVMCSPELAAAPAPIPLHRAIAAC